MPLSHWGEKEKKVPRQLSQPKKKKKKEKVISEKGKYTGENTGRCRHTSIVNQGPVTLWYGEKMKGRDHFSGGRIKPTN